MLKKGSLVLMGALCASSLFAQESVDEKVFVRSYVSKLSEQLALEAATGASNVASKDEKKALPHVVAMNVGSNIPSTGEKQSGLQSYVSEIAKKMEKNSSMVISAPASYGVVFQDGSRSDDEIFAQVEEVLTKIGASKDNDVIVKGLSDLKGVNRATFVRREDKLVLVTDPSALVQGEAIWRKTPTGVEQDFYHTEKEYLIAIRMAGLVCEEIVRPSFSGMIKWKNYNDSLKDNKEKLGSAYMENNPFTLYYVRKAS